MSWSWNNTDFSPYARLAHHRLTASFLRAIGIISADRYRKLLTVDPQIVVWDLRRRFPYADETFDAVYSSHFLEHLDRGAVPDLLAECMRVLKRDGIIRTVVPDLLAIVNRYKRTAMLLENGNRDALKDHGQSVMDLFDQMVRARASGTAKGSLFVRSLERLCRGGARRQGELHRWMYDKYTLSRLLFEAGFIEIEVHTPFTSRIEGWGALNLDADGNGAVCKPGLLYIEGAKR